MEGSALRRRLDRLKRPYTQLAPLLGLSIDGLHKQMRGERPVSCQTELLLVQLEQGPDREDYEAVEREHGRLPNNATEAQRADRYRLAQAHKLIRLVRRQK